MPVHIQPAHGNSFSDGYRMAVFQLWYRLGKPNARAFYNQVEDDPVRMSRPTLNTLMQWISTDFADQAEILDQQVEKAIQERLVEEKVQMLQKHAQVAQNMQDMATEYLEKNRENLKVPNAVRLLVEGIRIERESRGIPQALQKMVNSSDEELLKQVQDILVRTPVTIEPLDDEE